MPLDVSGVLIVLMMSGKKLSELRFVFILYSQDTFATTYGYVLCLPIGQANFALFQFQNGNKPKKKDLIRQHLLFLKDLFFEEINFRLLKCFGNFPWPRHFLTINFCGKPFIFRLLSGC